MPCDSIRYLSVKLEKSDWTLLDKAIRALEGVQDVYINVERQHARFTLNGEYVEIYNGQVRARAEITQGVVARINQGYSRQVVKAGALRHGAELRQIAKNKVVLKLRS